MNKRGFTLVELSIVLVIIGLLVGGILTGQSIIDSVKITSMVRQVQQVDIAQGVFYQKFKQFAGDSTLFLPAGNGNRKTAPVGVGAEGAESAGSFTQMVQGAGFKLEKAILAGTAGIVSPKNSDGANSSGKIVYLTVANVEISFDDVLQQSLIPPAWVIDSNLLGMGNHYLYTVQTATNSYEDAYSPQTAYVLDKKMDDGLPNIGNLRSNDASGNRYPCAVRADGSRSSVSTLKNDPSLKYDLSGAYKDDPCSVYIKVGFTQH